MEIDGQPFDFDVEHLHPVAAGLVHHRQRVIVPDRAPLEVGALRHVGIPRDDRDDVQARQAPQRGGEEPRDVDRPQVLVLEVDKALCPVEGLGIAAGDAALAEGRERVPGPALGIRAQELHRAAAARWGVPARCGQWRRYAGQAAQAIRDYVPGQPRRCRRVLPAVSKEVLHLAHRWATQLHLDVVHRWVWP